MPWCRWSTGSSRALGSSPSKFACRTSKADLWRNLALLDIGATFLFAASSGLRGTVQDITERKPKRPGQQPQDGGKETRFAVCVNALKRCRSGCILRAAVAKFSGFPAPTWTARVHGHRYRQSTEPCAHLNFDFTGNFHGPIHQHDAEPRTG